MARRHLLDLSRRSGRLLTMLGNSLFTLLDDIASLLDDVAAMTKVATKKTAGVLGDDLALNAEQVSGVEAKRELAVIWAVAKGSVWNKAILVPLALILSIALPMLVTPLLMLGGSFLCFEGAEKLLHRSAKGSPAPPQSEEQRIRGAIRTDLILSGEIIIISLGTVSQEPWPMRLAALLGVSAVMTVGVYGLVAVIVKLDDIGLLLSRRSGGSRLGTWLVAGAPLLLRFLSVAGTAAMFLVGGGIVAHGIPWLHALSHRASELPIGLVWSSAFEGLVGLLLGFVLALIQKGFAKKSAAN